MTRRLYVGNLSYDITKDVLEACFADCGSVGETHMPLDHATGKYRGFAFVTMSTEEGAAKAITQLNGVILEGRPLRVNAAEDRPGGRGRDGAGAPASVDRGGSSSNNEISANGESSNRNARGGHRGW